MTSLSNSTTITILSDTLTNRYPFTFKTESEYGRDSSNLKKYETEVDNITKQLQNMNYEDGSFEEMEENYRQVKISVQNSTTRW